jgi:hypothetical protein
MRAISAFLNGAGARGKVKAGGTDRSRLSLIDVLITMGLTRGEPIKIGSTPLQGGSRRATARGPQRFPR